MTPHRTDPRAGDVELVERLVAATGFFNPDEVRIAAELVTERIEKGLASGYRFVFVDDVEHADLLAYSCFGPVEGTARSWDLFWIAVQPRAQGRGIGRKVLEITESMIGASGGGLVWVETGGKASYASTRAFYERCGYAKEAELRDFYAPGDAKVVFVREIPAASS